MHASMHVSMNAILMPEAPLPEDAQVAYQDQSYSAHYIIYIHAYII